MEENDIFQYRKHFLFPESIVWLFQDTIFKESPYDGGRQWPTDSLAVLVAFPGEAKAGSMLAGPFHCPLPGRKDLLPFHLVGWDVEEMGRRDSSTLRLTHSKFLLSKITLFYPK